MVKNEVLQNNLAIEILAHLQEYASCHIDEEIIKQAFYSQESYAKELDTFCLKHKLEWAKVNPSQIKFTMKGA